MRERPESPIVLRRKGDWFDQHQALDRVPCSLVPVAQAAKPWQSFGDGRRRSARCRCRRRDVPIAGPLIPDSRHRHLLASDTRRWEAENPVALRELCSKKRTPARSWLEAMPSLETAGGYQGRCDFPASTAVKIPFSWSSRYAIMSARIAKRCPCTRCADRPLLPALCY